VTKIATTKTRRLQLHKVTLRNLHPRELSLAAGGQIMSTVWIPTWTCWCSDNKATVSWAELMCCLK